MSADTRPLDAQEIREFIKRGWKRQTLEERAAALEGFDALVEEVERQERSLDWYAARLGKANAEVERLTGENKLFRLEAQYRFAMQRTPRTRPDEYARLRKLHSDVQRQLDEAQVERHNSLAPQPEGAKP